MSSVIVAIAGPIRAGKSVLAKSLAEAIGWNVGAFGREVRKEAARRGVPETRDSLQEIGEELVATNSAGLCKAVLDQAEWNPGVSVIVDGVRHQKVLRELRVSVQPHPVVLVYVHANEVVRATRAGAIGLSPDELRKYDRHSTEVEVLTVLRAGADIEVDGSKSIGDLVSKVRASLQI